MKYLHFYLILGIALGLNACSLLKSFDGETERNDYLVYLIDDGSRQRQLIQYDPANNSHTQILHDWDIEEFCLSKNYRLAFSSSRDGNSNIYVLDYPFSENVPIKITLDSATENTPISWSPDEHYLLFDSVRADNKKLSVWDGKNISSIYEYHEQVGEVSWSPSSQLTFTDFYTFISPRDGDPSEIFIWDGNFTVSLSQNPSGEDRFPMWSQDGQLAFLSERNDKYGIFVWDGISMNNGLPDINTFENIAPELTQYFSHPTWTNSGSIAFSGSDDSDLYAQIYEWDGETARNISKNPSSHNGGQTWRDDGYWAFVTFFSGEQKLYIRDHANQTILETKGQYQPAWSQKGVLLRNEEMC